MRLHAESLPMRARSRRGRLAGFARMPSKTTARVASARGRAQRVTDRRPGEASPPRRHPLGHDPRHGVQLRGADARDEGRDVNARGDGRQVFDRPGRTERTKRVFERVDDQKHRVVVKLRLPHEGPPGNCLSRERDIIWLTPIAQRPGGPIVASMSKGTRPMVNPTAPSCLLAQDGRRPSARSARKQARKSRGRTRRSTSVMGRSAKSA